MAKDVQLSRLSLRRDQILEANFAGWPEPSPKMLGLPGVNDWWTQLKLARERDVGTFEKLINNIRNSQTIIIEARTTDPVNPVNGQIWLRVDL